MTFQKQHDLTSVEEDEILKKLLGGEVLFQGNSFPKPKAYWSDSRKVRPGDAFFALPGKNADGHAFVPDALRRGASLVFVEKNKQSILPSPLPEGCKIFLVKNTEEALRLLGKYRLSRLPLEKTLGITGSVGKTTTKNLLQDLLSHWYPTYCTKESFNTSVGIDLSLASAPENTRFLLLEFGANSFGEIRELAGKYAPEIGIITDVAPAHTQGFSSLEGVLRAKLELAESPRMENLFFNEDSPLLSSFFTSRGSFAYRPIPVGKKAHPSRGIAIHSAKVHLGTTPKMPFLLRSEVSLFGESLSFEAPFYCDHHVYACAFSLGVLKILGISLPHDVNDLFSSFQVPPGRGRIFLVSQGFFLFDESYNANPKSMESSLCNFRDLPLSGKRVLLLGGMKELGGYSKEAHLRTVSLFPSFEQILLLGEEWHTPEIRKYIEREKLSQRIVMLNSSKEASGYLRKLSLREGDALFVKGSRSYGLETVVEELRLW